MGIFTRRSRQNTASSNVSSLGPNTNTKPTTASPSSSNPSSPFISSGTFGKSGKTTPSSLSPNPSHRPNSRSGPQQRSPSPSRLDQTINLRVAIDPIPLKGNNEDAKNLFYVQVSPEEGIAALRREIARTVGHGSMGLFKVSIPQQAFNQSKSYTERYGKSVQLLSQFPAFNLDDPNQLNLSLGPNINGESSTSSSSALGLGELKIKHWFPEFINFNNQSDNISIIARPLLGMPINHVPLTLRAYFAQPPQSSSSSAGPSRLRSSPPPIVVDINPFITVDELKSELLRAAGKNSNLWKFVVLWQIAMTESEMNVIDELGRLKNGKMPWPYPPGAMEPIPMSDGNLPVSLFFPKSAPNGDMLNLSIWLNPTCETNSTATLPALARDIPHFRYPMNNLTRPASTHCVSPTLSHLPLSPLVTEPPSYAPIASSSTTLKVKKSRIRPSTAPASSINNNGNSAPKSFGSNSIKTPPLNSIRSINRTTPNPASTPTHTMTPRGLGIVTPSIITTNTAISSPLLDRTSFSSTVSTESEVSITSTIPSLNFSQQSLDTPTVTNVETPQDERLDWLTPALTENMLKKSASVNKGSFRARLKKVL